MAKRPQIHPIQSTGITVTDETVDLLFVLYMLADETIDEAVGTSKLTVNTWKVYEFMGKPIRISLTRFRDKGDATTYDFPTLASDPDINWMFHQMLHKSSPEEVVNFDEEFVRSGSPVADALGIENTSLSSLAQTIEITSPLKDQLELYKTAISTILSQRYIFFTNVRLLGIGPKGMKPGDVVMVPEGAQTPYVYRRVDDGGDTRYGYLIGECYIHGLMDGDPAEQLKSN